MFLSNNYLSTAIWHNFVFAQFVKTKFQTQYTKQKSETSKWNKTPKNVEKITEEK